MWLGTDLDAKNCEQNSSDLAVPHLSAVVFSCLLRLFLRVILRLVEGKPGS